MQQNNFGTLLILLSSLFFFLVCQFPSQDQFLYRTLLRPISVNVNGLGLLARDFKETILTVRPVREYGVVGLKQALQNEELCWRARPVDPKNLCCSWAHKRSTYLWKTSRNDHGQDFPMPFSPDSWLKLITWLLFYTDIKFWYLFFFTNLCLIVLLLKGLHLFLSFTTLSVGSEKHFLSCLHYSV